MQNYEFQNIEALWLFCLLPIFIFWQIKVNSNRSAYFQTSGWTGTLNAHSFKEKLHQVSWIFPSMAIALITFALAGPRTSDIQNQQIKGEGIDIMIVLDISTSMLAEDFLPNRLEAAKKVANNFIQARYSDRIGMVVYAGEAFTQCPLTTDHSVLKNLVNEVSTNMQQIDGTAIGMGLATAVDRLKDSKAKSKVCILLSDGVNNSGAIDPLTSADLASTYNIRTYTIGVGSDEVPQKVRNPFTGRTSTRMVKSEIDETLLKKVAQTTGGTYFRAKDENSLNLIYDEIDQLEKTKLQELNFTQYDEKFLNFLVLAICLLILDTLLKYFYFKSVLV